MPLVQSEPARHILPSAHFAHMPPQSTSVSVPFFILSLHDGAVLHTLLVQTALRQSLPSWHILPSSQAGHVPPPQSTSVSLPSCSMFMHCDGAHIPLVHVMLRQ